MWRRLESFRAPALIRLLVLFAILTIPLLAGRLIAHLRGEPPGISGPARPDLAKRP